MSMVSKPRVPEGLRDLMKDLTKEILKEKPTDIYDYAENYFHSRLPQKENYAVDSFEEDSAKYDFSYIKNAQCYQVPVALAYSIIPEALTSLIKDLIKAVLREQPKNLCDFAVEYFRHLKVSSKENTKLETREINYMAYDSYFNKKERFLFTPYLKCTCGRTPSKLFENVLQTNNLSEIQEAPSRASLRNGDYDCEENNTNKIFFETNKTNSQINAIYIIQRHFRSYLMRKNATTIRRTPNPDELSLNNDELKKEQAQFTESNLTDLTMRFLPHLQMKTNDADVNSEDASYTSASTVLVSATESGRETSESNTKENISTKTIIENVKTGNDEKNYSLHSIQSEFGNKEAEATNSNSQVTEGCIEIEHDRDNESTIKNDLEDKLNIPTDLVEKLCNSRATANIGLIHSMTEISGVAKTFGSEHDYNIVKPECSGDVSESNQMHKHLTDIQSANHKEDICSSLVNAENNEVDSETNKSAIKYLENNPEHFHEYHDMRELTSLNNEKIQPNQLTNPPVGNKNTIIKDKFNKIEQFETEAEDKYNDSTVFTPNEAKTVETEARAKNDKSEINEKNEISTEGRDKGRTDKILLCHTAEAELHKAKEDAAENVHDFGTKNISGKISEEKEELLSDLPEDHVMQSSKHFENSHAAKHFEAADEQEINNSNKNLQEQKRNSFDLNKTTNTIAENKTATTGNRNDSLDNVEKYQSAISDNSFDTVQITSHTPQKEKFIVKNIDLKKETREEKEILSAPIRNHKEIKSSIEQFDSVEDSSDKILSSSELESKDHCCGDIELQKNIQEITSEKKIASKKSNQINEVESSEIIEVATNKSFEEEPENDEKKTNQTKSCNEIKKGFIESRKTPERTDILHNLKDIENEELHIHNDLKVDQKKIPKYLNSKIDTINANNMTNKTDDATYVEFPIEINKIISGEEKKLQTSSKEALEKTAEVQNLILQNKPSELKTKQTEITAKKDITEKNLKYEYNRNESIEKTAANLQEIEVAGEQLTEHNTDMSLKKLSDYQKITLNNINDSEINSSYESSRKIKPKESLKSKEQLNVKNKGLSSVLQSEISEYIDPTEANEISGKLKLNERSDENKIFGDGSEMPEGIEEPKIGKNSQSHLIEKHDDLAITSLQINENDNVVISPEETNDVIAIKDKCTTPKDYSTNKFEDQKNNSKLVEDTTTEITKTDNVIPEAANTKSLAKMENSSSVFDTNDLLQNQGTSVSNISTADTLSLKLVEPLNENKVNTTNEPSFDKSFVLNSQESTDNKQSNNIPPPTSNEINSNNPTSVNNNIDKQCESESEVSPLEAKKSKVSIETRSLSELVEEYSAAESEKGNDINDEITDTLENLKANNTESKKDNIGDCNESESSKIKSAESNNNNDKIENKLRNFKKGNKMVDINPSTNNLTSGILQPENKSEVVQSVESSSKLLDELSEAVEDNNINHEVIENFKEYMDKEMAETDQIKTDIHLESAKDKNNKVELEHELTQLEASHTEHSSELLETFSKLNSAESKNMNDEIIATDKKFNDLAVVTSQLEANKVEALSIIPTLSKLLENSSSIASEESNNENDRQSENLKKLGTEQEIIDIDSDTNNATGNNNVDKNIFEDLEIKDQNINNVAFDIFQVEANKTHLLHKNSSEVLDNFSEATSAESKHINHDDLKDSKEDVEIFVMHPKMQNINVGARDGNKNTELKIDSEISQLDLNKIKVLLQDENSFKLSDDLPKINAKGSNETTELTHKHLKMPVDTNKNELLLKADNSSEFSEEFSKIKSDEMKHINAEMIHNLKTDKKVFNTQSNKTDIGELKNITSNISIDEKFCDMNIILKSDKPTNVEQIKNTNKSLGNIIRNLSRSDSGILEDKHEADTMDVEELKHKSNSKFVADIDHSENVRIIKEKVNSMRKNIEEAQFNIVEELQINKEVKKFIKRQNRIFEKSSSSEKSQNVNNTIDDSSTLEMATSQYIRSDSVNNNLEELERHSPYEKLNENHECNTKDTKVDNFTKVEELHEKSVNIEDAPITEIIESSILKDLETVATSSSNQKTATEKHGKADIYQTHMCPREETKHTNDPIQGNLSKLPTELEISHESIKIHANEKPQKVYNEISHIIQAPSQFQDNEFNNCELDSIDHTSGSSERVASQDPYASKYPTELDVSNGFIESDENPRRDFDKVSQHAIHTVDVFQNSNQGSRETSAPLDRKTKSLEPNLEEQYINSNDIEKLDEEKSPLRTTTIKNTDHEFGSIKDEDFVNKDNLDDKTVNTNVHDELHEQSIINDEANIPSDQKVNTTRETILNHSDDNLNADHDLQDTNNVSRSDKDDLNDNRNHNHKIIDNAEQIDQNVKLESNRNERILSSDTNRQAPVIGKQVQVIGDKSAADSNVANVDDIASSLNYATDTTTNSDGPNTQESKTFGVALNPIKARENVVTSVTHTARRKEKHLNEQSTENLANAETQNADNEESAKINYSLAPNTTEITGSPQIVLNETNLYASEALSIKNKCDNSSRANITDGEILDDSVDKRIKRSTETAEGFLKGCLKRSDDILVSGNEGTTEEKGENSALSTPLHGMNIEGKFQQVTTGQQNTAEKEENTYCEETTQNIGIQTAETHIGNQNLKIGRIRNCKDGLIGSFSGQRFAETHLRSFWKEYLLNNSVPLSEYKYIENEQKQVVKPQRNYNRVSETIISDQKHPIGDQEDHVLDNEIKMEAKELPNSVPHIISCAANDANLTTEIGCLPKYCYGTSDTAQNNYTNHSKAKSCKAPTAFTIPIKQFSKNHKVKPATPIDSSNSKKVSVTSDKASNFMQFKLTGRAEFEPLLDAETPTKLFEDFNELEYEIHNADTSNYGHTNISGENSLTPEPRLQTIIELSESATQKPIDYLESNNNVFLANIEKKNDSTSSSWTTDSKDDNSFVSGEFFEAQNNVDLRSEVSATSTGNQIIRGGIYEFAKDETLDEEDETQIGSLKLIAHAPSPPNDDPFEEDLKATAATTIQKYFRQYIEKRANRVNLKQASYTPVESCDKSKEIGDEMKVNQIDAYTTSDHYDNDFYESSRILTLSDSHNGDVILEKTRMNSNNRNNEEYNCITNISNEYVENIPTYKACSSNENITKEVSNFDGLKSVCVQEKIINMGKKDLPLIEGSDHSTNPNTSNSKVDSKVTQNLEEASKAPSGPTIKESHLKSIEPERTTSSWYVGDEQIVANDALTKTTSEILFEETEAYVELETNSPKYLVDLNSSLENIDPSNFSRSPTAPVLIGSRSSIDMLNDQSNNISKDSVTATEIQELDNANILPSNHNVNTAFDGRSLKDGNGSLSSYNKETVLKYTNLIDQFISSERLHSEINHHSNSGVQIIRNIEFKTPDIAEISHILTQFKNFERAYEHLEEAQCIKKYVSTPRTTPDREIITDTTTNTETSSISDVDDTEDSLSTKTVKLSKPDLAISKMKERRDSTTKVSLLDKLKDYSFDEPLVAPIDVLDTDEEGIVFNKLQREDTRESSGQSDNDVIIGIGKDDNFNYRKNVAIDETFPVKGSLKRVYTIANDSEAKLLLKNVTIDESIKYIEPPDYEINSCNVSLDMETSENIRRQIMAYSISEADSECFNKNDNYDDSSSWESKTGKYDDFNVSTALVESINSSTETESTIVSAVTKIQAGARGYLTRKRLEKTVIGSNGKSMPSDEPYKSSFGNAAITESLEHLVQETAAKKIQTVYRLYCRKKLDKEKLTTKRENSLAQKRSTMLQRGVALRDNSTPDGGSSNSNGSESENCSLQVKENEEKELKKLSNSTLPAKTTVEIRVNKIKENKLKWFAMRQNSMPVQIDSEVLRVIPKYMRKKIKSAEGEKPKSRRRVLKD